MIHFKGLVERQIGGKLITFKFNMAALVFFGELSNLTLRALSHEFINPRLSTVANFLYAGAVTYCRQEKKPQDFTQDDAAEWLAEIGLDEVLIMLRDAISVPEPKQQPEETKN